jgi:hypothetical protein
LGASLSPGIERRNRARVGIWYRGSRSVAVVFVHAPHASAGRRSSDAERSASQLRRRSLGADRGQRHLGRSGRNSMPIPENG